MDQIAILQTLKGLENDLRLPGVVAEAPVLWCQILLESLAESWIKIKLRSAQDVRIRPHLFGLATQAATGHFHAVIRESDKYTLGHQTRCRPGDFSDSNINSRPEDRLVGMAEDQKILGGRNKPGDRNLPHSGCSIPTGALSRQEPTVQSSAQM
ncbi:hypothetical protein VB738_10320 [Cyanobium gracile UHCC 0139]|uniref:Uncharacterized protein n=1 Tax=Cyanobium gracile UHCC 0139 TaxID=3110308 RepID=A0ABU5RV51_9CYAN|nr:hypothetical protein [Cyanobium gracile]MEA5391651.1 hypothetical protein [Cyanobium gracile UHCC 0139]